MSDGPPQPPVPEATLLEIGPILIGALLSWTMLGISTVQLYIYHVSFFNDRKFIQAAVYITFLLDIFQSIVAASTAWHFLVGGWGRRVNLESPDWAFIALPIVSGLVALGVQTFYAWRMWKLGRWRVVPGIIIFTALISAGAACAAGIGVAYKKSVASLHLTSVMTSSILWLGAAAATDITIMSSMLWLLYAAKRRTRPMKRSELLVNRLIELTIETGSACAVATLVQVGLFAGMPSTNLHLAIALILSKIYSNTLMAWLNSRSRWSESISRRQLLNPSIAIHITHEVATDRDVADDKSIPAFCEVESGA